MNFGRTLEVRSIAARMVDIDAKTLNSHCPQSFKALYTPIPASDLVDKYTNR